MKEQNITIQNSLNNEDIKIVTVETNTGLCTISTQYRGFLVNGVLKQTVPARTQITCNVTKKVFKVSAEEVDDILSSIYKIRKYISDSNTFMIGRGYTLKRGNEIYYESMVFIPSYGSISYGMPEYEGMAVWFKQEKIETIENISFKDAFSIWQKEITTPYTIKKDNEKHIVNPEIYEHSLVGRKLTKKNTINGSFRVLMDWLLKRL